MWSVIDSWAKAEPPHLLRSEVMGDSIADAEALVEASKRHLACSRQCQGRHAQRSADPVQFLQRTSASMCAHNAFVNTAVGLIACMH